MYYFAILLHNNLHWSWLQDGLPSLNSWDGIPFNGIPTVTSFLSSNMTSATGKVVIFNVSFWARTRSCPFSSSWISQMLKVWASWNNSEKVEKNAKLVFQWQFTDVSVSHIILRSGFNDSLGERAETLFHLNPQSNACCIWTLNILKPALLEFFSWPRLWSIDTGKTNVIFPGIRSSLSELTAAQVFWNCP